MCQVEFEKISFSALSGSPSTGTWKQSQNKDFPTTSHSTTKCLKHLSNFESAEKVRSSNVVEFEFRLLTSLTTMAKARFSAIGSAMQRNIPYCNATQCAAMHRCAQSSNSVTALCKHPQANKNEFLFSNLLKRFEVRTLLNSNSDFSHL